jgi:diguanylate cyclase (GGDEF)-like protein
MSVSAEVVALAHSRAHLRISVLADRDFNIQWISENVRCLLGRSPNSFLDTNAVTHVHPDDIAAVAETLVYELGVDSSTVRPHNVRLARDIRLASEKGEWVLFEAYVSNLLDDPDVGMFLIDLQVPSQHHLIDEALEAAWIKEDSTAVLDAILCRLTRGGTGETTALITTPGTDRILARSANFLPDASFEEVTATQPSSVARWTRAISLRETSGELGVLHVWSPNELMHPVDVEMSERVAQQAAQALNQSALRSELAKAAFLDPLTGIGNRRAMQQALVDVDAAGELVMLAYLDLDGFKSINDEHGHDAGDELLKAVAQRLTKSMRPNDLVARIGGDEFAILFTATLPDAEIICARIETLVSMPITYEGSLLAVSTSVGVATGKSAGFDLLTAADRAMFAMKQKRRACSGHSVQ